VVHAAASALDIDQHRTGPALDLSVVIPIKNEAENLAPLIAEIHAALDGLVPFEIVYVDDGSTDDSVPRLQAIQAGDPTLRLVRHAQSCGQSTAVRSGVKAAQGRWIATLDGDGQNDPADIPNLWRLAQAAPPGRPAIYCGHRTKRRDTLVKRLSSRFANGLRARLLGDATPDTGCGLKLFERAVFLELPYFNHMHRYLPALVLRLGGTVVSVEVNHRPRERGTSNYGTIDRALVGIVDLFGVMWLQRRAKVPVLLDPTV